MKPTTPTKAEMQAEIDYLRLRGEKQLEVITVLQATVERQRQDGHDSDRIIGRMSSLLTLTADALKGEPDELTMHDWSDLPYMARALVQELQSYHETNHIQHVPPEPKGGLATLYFSHIELNVLIGVVRSAMAKGAGTELMWGQLNALDTALTETIWSLENPRVTPARNEQPQEHTAVPETIRAMNEKSPPG
jgi:hypothetical protein